MTTKNTFQGVRAHVSGSYRTETLHGQEYIVVPVVALVEGVLQGMSASGPELALASEFGKFPDSWNGRPAVMSHPIDSDGRPVSANSPKILETYQIGFLFNTALRDNKLHQEAWINKSIMTNLNSDTKEVMETLEKGEMIEVSTGYFAEIEPTTGMYANSEYEGIQRSVTPDHLAFLPIGTLGACSNADGCGAQLAANSSPDKKFTPVKDFRVDSPCCSTCAETGGTCTHDRKGSSMPETNTTMDTQDPANKKKKKGDPKAYEALTIANTIAGGVMLDDVYKFVSCALKDAGYGTYCYIVGMTTDKVIYQMYNMFMGEYETYQESYTITSDGVVTLGGDQQQVALMTTIVTVNRGKKTESNPAPGEGESSMTAQTTKPGETPTPQANTDKKEPRTETVTNEQGVLEINYDAEGKVTGYKLTPKAQEAKKPATAEEFIAQAPPEMQEVLKASLSLHASQKKALISQIKDTKRCKMSDAKLEAMSLEDLQEIAELANVPSFAGRALPIAQSAGDDEVTPAPLVFEAPKSVAA
jgi:hypothetical protein